MRPFSTALFALALAAVVHAKSTFFQRTNTNVLSSFTKKSDAAASALFGVVSRGGALFGKDKDSKTATPTAAAKMYPPLTQPEIEEWLSHIPVFAVTDSNGAGVVLKPDNDTSVFYFFMSPQMANATLSQLKGTNEELDLRVSAFSLGKIWFKILNSDDSTEVKLKQPGNSDDTATVTKGVEYRLVPDTRDLLGARMLLTMDPEEGKKLQEGGSLTPEMATNAIQKAMTSSPKFNSTFNEIPVFMIQQMRMQKQPENPSSAADGNTNNEEAVTLLPMYFNLQNMVSIWQQFATQSPDAKDVEPAINLMDLFELVQKMQEESEIDFRHVVLVPPVPVGAPAEAEAMQDDGFKMPGDETLGDL